MGAKLVIEWQGLDQVISNLSAIGEKAPQNLEHQVKELASDTEREWKQVTPRRTGRLQEGDNVEPSEMSFTLKNATRYYDWVDTGHMTPKGWHTKRGYRPAKRRSHVKGQEMTSKTIQFVEENINDYLSKFLDNM